MSGKDGFEPMGGLQPPILRSTPAFSDRLRGFGLVGLQLALLLFIVRRFEIEERNHLFPLLCLTAGAFAIHAWLPLRFRASFFVLASLAGMLLILGWSNGSMVIGIGLGLIAVCHLPGPLFVRVIVFVLAGTQLAALRVESPAPFWPVLGSMFMFRLIIYVFETRHERARAPLPHILAYFFPLPNVCFTLFPVLDFKTFRRTYYDTEDYTIYKTGTAWMVRGLCHLIGYRFIKYYVLPAPQQLGDLPHLMLFLAANYALYLHVSGWFHLITGLLHLFGFNLPRTHHNYFLASSVSDVWRRINIYWKDFMAKVFFYPAYLALQGWGTTFALAAAGLGVFVVTWLLHSYQVFWLRSELPLSWNEAALWLLAGVLVSINLQLDLRRSRQAPLAAAPGDGWVKQEALAGAALALRIAGTFLLVSLFWACWTLPQFPTYFYVAATSTTITALDVVIVLGCLAVVAALGAVVRLGRERLSRGGLALPTVFSLSSGVLPTVVLVVLAVSAAPGIDAVLGPQSAEMLAALRQESATPVEAAAVVQGYYEEIVTVPVQVAPLVGLPGLPKQQPPPFAYHNMTRPSDDFLENELIPDWSGDITGKRVTINNLGMRDRAGISVEKPAGVCRLAFVGSSVVMGYRVGDDETFCRLLEARLNAQRPDDPRHIEVLNFGMGMSHAIHRRTLIERKVFGLSPDAIYYVAHQDEYLGTVRHLTRLIERNNALPAYLRDVAQKVGVDAQTPPGLSEVRLLPSAPGIVRGVYFDIVQQCRRREILPVWIYLPMPGVVDVTIRSSELIGLAQEAGFIVLNLAKWTEGHDPKVLMADASHASALGHQLIAERLEAVLRARPEALPVCGRP
jgi:hypothetical protein